MTAVKNSDTLFAFKVMLITTLINVYFLELFPLSVRPPMYPIPQPYK